MSRVPSIVVASLLCLTLAGGAWAAELRVKLACGRVGLDAHCVRVSDVLRELSRVARFCVRADPVNALRSELLLLDDSFEGLPLPLALDRILRGVPHVIRLSRAGVVTGVDLLQPAISPQQLPGGCGGFVPPSPDTAVRPWGTEAVSLEPLNKKTSPVPPGTAGRTLGTATAASTVMPANVAVAAMTPIAARAAETPEPAAGAASTTPCRTVEEARQRLERLRRSHVRTTTR